MPGPGRRASPPRHGVRHWLWACVVLVACCAGAWGAGLSPTTDSDLSSKVPKGYGIWGLKSFDLNKNGRQAIAACTYYQQPSQMSVFIVNNTDGTAAGMGALNVANPGACSYVETADIDGDGNKDLIVSEYISSAGVCIRWHKGQGAYKSFAASYTAIHSSCVYPDDFRVADMDGDGDLDVVLLEYSASGRVMVMRNNGAGTAWTEVDLVTGFYGWCLEVADFTGDGRMDVIAGISGTTDAAGPAYIHVNTATAGTFLAPRQIFAYAGSYRFTAADLDNDGWMDLMVGGESTSPVGGWVTVYRNFGVKAPGYFNRTLLDSGSALGRINSIEAADLNYDGSLDIVVPSRSQSQISWFENMGNGTFLPRVVLYTGSGGGTAVKLADVNNDGVIDIIAGWGGSTLILTVHINNGVPCTNIRPADYSSFVGAGMGNCTSNLRNTQCSLNCTFGYTRTAYTLGKCRGPLWQNATITCAAATCSPPSISNADVSACSGKTTTQTCALACSNGYVATGVATYSCTGTGVGTSTFQPTGTAFTCPAATCATPTITNANNALCASKTTTQTCTLTCVNGYVAGGTATYICNAAGVGTSVLQPTSGSAFTCTAAICAAPSISNAITAGCTNNKTGDTCLLACQLGYIAAGNAQYDCLGTGVGTSAFSPHGSVYSCTAATCANPTVANAVTSDCTSKTTGQSCTLSCNNGYASGGVATYICTGTGVGTSTSLPSGAAFTCTAVACAAPSISNAITAGCANNKTGDTCLLACQYGYVPTGNAQYDCLGTGAGTSAFSPHGSVFSCPAATCAAPVIANAVTSACASTTTTQTCTLTCANGYVATGTSQYDCLGTGVGTSALSAHLSGTPFTCPAATCPTPSITNAIVAGCVGNKTGDTCLLNCQSGYVPTGTSQYDCLATGVGTSAHSAHSGGQVFTCPAATCATPSISNAVTTNCVGKTTTQVCTLTCANGYIATGTSQYDCLGTGVGSSALSAHLSGTPFTCPAATCPTPTITNGVTAGCVGNKTGDTCLLNCQSGYVPTGTSQYDCLPAGVGTSAHVPHSSGTTFTCPAATCAPPSIANADVSACTGKTTGQVCTLSCASGYIAGGTSQYDCLATGVGSSALSAHSGGPSFTCTPASCATPSITNANNALCAGLVTGGICTLTCANGYVATGTSQYDCTASGVGTASLGPHSGTTPFTCPAATCNTPSITNAVTTNCVGKTTTQTCTLSCASGYTATGTSQYDCLATGVGTSALSAHSGGQTFTCPPSTCAPLSVPLALSNCSGTVTGDTCALTCPAGHTSSGQSTYVCTAAAPGSSTLLPLGGGTAFQCTPASCSAPTGLHVNTTSCQGLVTGKSCNVSCDLGFAVNGSLRYDCLASGPTTAAGQPSDPANPPYCVTAPCAEPAFQGADVADCAHTMVNESCVVGCRAGYTFTSGATVYDCVDSGTPQPITVPHGGAATVCSAALCSTPSITNGDVSACVGRFTDQSCVLSCANGFTPTGTSQYDCLGTGVGASALSPSGGGTTFTCPAATCPTPVIANADVSACVGKATGQVCSLACNNGYIPTGTAQYDCLGTAVGTSALSPHSGGSAFSCAPAVCAPPSITNAVVSGCANNMTGETCLLRCSNGYTPSGTAQYDCLPTGATTSALSPHSGGTSFTCAAATCVPPTLANTDASACAGKTTGQTCTLSCINSNYAASGSSSYTCVGTAESTSVLQPTSGGAFTCTLLTCTTALNVPHGRVMAGGCGAGAVAAGSSCGPVTCEDGYQGNGGASNYNCVATGLGASFVPAAGQLLVCTAVSCAAPTAPRVVGCDSAVTGDTCTLTCASGVARGEPQQDCVANGPGAAVLQPVTGGVSFACDEITLVPATCAIGAWPRGVVVTCLDPTATSAPAGTLCEAHCLPQFIGASVNITCQASAADPTVGAWQGVPNCIEVLCPTLSITGGSVTGGHSYRDTARITCFYGYTLLGPNEITCGMTGAWSGNPTCVQNDASGTPPPAPVIDSVTPELLPMVGGALTVSGRYWSLPLQYISVAGVAMNMSTVTTSVSGNGRRLMQSSRWASFTVPPIDNEGYAAVVITDAASVVMTLENVLFLSDDCPTPGMYGSGVDCKPCPTGAVCPGGNRLWPLPGYWNEGEGSGFVSECPDPPTRCAGGRYTTCSSGYTGPLCAQCMVGFYMEGTVCTPCGAPSDNTILYIVTAVFFILMALGYIFLSDSHLTAVIEGFKLLQVIRAAGKGFPSGLPEGIRVVFDRLSLIAFDFDFLRYTCGTDTPLKYSTIFWGNAIMIAVMTIPPLLGLAFMACVHRKKRVFYKNRMMRTVAILITLVYLIGVTRVLEAVTCIKINGVYYLEVDTTTRCYSDDIDIRVLGWIGITALCVGLPIGLGGRLHQLARKDLLEDVNILARYGYLYEDLSRVGKRYMFAVVPFLQLFFTALCTSLFNDGDPALRYGLTGASFLVVILGIYIGRPHKEAKYRIVNLGAYTLGLLASIASMVCTNRFQLPTSIVLPVFVGACGVVLIAMALALVMEIRRARRYAHAVAPLDKVDVDKELKIVDLDGDGDEKAPSETSITKELALAPASIEPATIEPAAVDVPFATVITAVPNMFTPLAQTPAATPGRMSPRAGATPPTPLAAGKLVSPQGTPPVARSQSVAPNGGFSSLPTSPLSLSPGLVRANTGVQLSAGKIASILAEPADKELGELVLNKVPRAIDLQPEFIARTLSPGLSSASNAASGLLNLPRGVTGSLSSPNIGPDLSSDPISPPVAHTSQGLSGAGGSTKISPRVNRYALHRNLPGHVPATTASAPTGMGSPVPLRSASSAGGLGPGGGGGSLMSSPVVGRSAGDLSEGARASTPGSMAHTMEVVDADIP